MIFLKAIFLVLLFSISVIAETEPTTLRDLDLIVQKADSVAGFLNNPQIQNEYFAALQSYYGNYERRAFDAILEQLRTMDSALPEFSSRLWETTELGNNFELKSALKTSGRKVDYSEWSSYRGNWLKQLATTANLSFPITNKESLPAVKTYFEELRAKIAHFDEKIKERMVNARNSEARKSILAERANFLNQLKQDPKLKQANSFLLHRWLKLEEVTDALNSGDADLILDKLASGSLDPKQTLRGLQWDAPEVFAASMRDLLPTHSTLTNRQDYLKMLSELEKENRKRYPIEGDNLDEQTRQSNRRSRNRARENAYTTFNKGKIFPIDFSVDPQGRVVEAGSGTSATIHATALPRRFHGIWDGAVLGECVSGNCGSLESLTPERWGVIALRGTQKHHLTRNGSYLGFTQQIPGRINGETVASIEFGAPQLRNRAITVDSETGDKIPTTLFNLWLEESSKFIPKEWKARVIGKSDAINNAGVLTTVRNSQSYILNSPLGKSEDFHILDPIAKQIPSVIKLQGYGLNYGGRMITDATVKGQNELTPITPITEQDISKIAHSGDRDSLLIAMLKDTKWAQHPKAGIWVDLVLSRKNVDAQIVSDLLWTNAWSQHEKAEGWFKTVFERGSADTNIARALKLPTWGNSPTALKVLDTLVERGKSDLILVTEILKQPQWSSHLQMPSWLDKILTRSSSHQTVVEHLLFRSPWVSHEKNAEWLATVARSGKATSVLISHLADLPVNTPGLEALLNTVSERLDTHDLKKKFAEKILLQEGWARNPRSYLWYVRTNNLSGLGKHEKMILANQHHFAKEAREHLTYAAQEHPQHYTQESKWAFNEILRLLETDPEAVNALATLVINHRTFHHEKAFQRLLEIVTQEGERGEHAIRLLMVHVGIHGPSFRSSKEALIQDTIDLGKYLDSNDTQPWHYRNFDIHDLATEDALFKSLDKSIDVIFEGAMKNPKLAMEVALALGNLGSAYAQPTMSDEQPRGLESVATLWLLGGTIADKKKVPLARKALSRCIDLAIHYPIAAPWALRALKQALEKGFTDNGKTKEEAYRLAKNFPELLDNLKDFDKQVESAMIRQKAANRHAESFNALVEKFGVPHVVESDTPGIRKFATESIIAQSREADLNPFKIEGDFGKMMKQYHQNHSIECNEILKRLGNANWAIE